MTERFKQFMEVVLFNENGKGNGYVLNPDDKGGETFSGVCRKHFPQLQVWQKLDEIAEVKEKKKYAPTEEEWEEIYRVYYDRFYVPLRIDYIDNPKLALHLFDFGVNAGPATAIKTLQSVLGVKVDGKIGPVTISTANVQQRVAQNFILARKNHYEAIARRNPTQRRFLKGWLNRVDRTLPKSEMS